MLVRATLRRSESVKENGGEPAEALVTVMERLAGQVRTVLGICRVVLDRDLVVMPEFLLCFLLQRFL